MARRASSSGSRQQTPSLGEYVYQELKSAIRDGDYHPGERIRESEVSAKLKVSRTPVREALRRLQSEGRLKSEPQRGVVVAELDRHEVAELYTLRQNLEGFAARLAAQHASETEIETMAYILERTRSLGSDLRQLNQINWELHHAIYNAAHNRFLTQAFSALSDSLALLRGAIYIPADRPAKLFEEHRHIIEAIRARDPDAADAAAQAHVRQAFRTHLDASFELRTSKGLSGQK